MLPKDDHYYFFFFCLGILKIYPIYTRIAFLFSIYPATLGSRIEGHTQKVAGLQQPTLMPCCQCWKCLLYSLHVKLCSGPTLSTGIPGLFFFFFNLEPSLPSKNINFCLFCSSITSYYALKPDLRYLCLCLSPAPVSTKLQNMFYSYDE